MYLLVYIIKAIIAISIAYDRHDPKKNQDSRHPAFGCPDLSIEPPRAIEWGSLFQGH